MEKEKNKLKKLPECCYIDANRKPIIPTLSFSKFKMGKNQLNMRS